MAMEVLHGSAKESFAYYGTREGWLIALSQHRDSDTIERSNWQVITEDMGSFIEADDAAIERMNHWAVGWIEYLLIRPDSPAVAAATKWREKLARYPVADDEHHSTLEWAEEWCVRCDRGVRIDHPVNGCKKFRSAEDASEIEYSWRTRNRFKVWCKVCGRMMRDLLTYENHTRDHEFGGS